MSEFNAVRSAGPRGRPLVAGAFPFRTTPTGGKTRVGRAAGATPYLNAGRASMYAGMESGGVRLTPSQRPMTPTVVLLWEPVAKPLPKPATIQTDEEILR